MSENSILPVDKKTWNKWSFYINVVIFIIIAVFIYLLIKDSIDVGAASNDTSRLSNAWFMVVRDIAFLAAGFVIIFFQLFNYYKQLNRRSW